MLWSGADCQFGAARRVLPIFFCVARHGLLPVCQTTSTRRLHLAGAYQLAALKILWAMFPSIRTMRRPDAQELPLFARRAKVPGQTYAYQTAIRVVLGHRWSERNVIEIKAAYPRRLDWRRIFDNGGFLHFASVSQRALGACPVRSTPCLACGQGTASFSPRMGCANGSDARPTT